MRRRTRSMGTKELVGDSGSAGRQTAFLVLALLIAGLLAPVGAQAAKLVSAVITDPGGVNQAMVDAAGNLHTTSADDPGRMVLQRDVVIPINPGATVGFAEIGVPEGKRLVITHVSGGVSLPTGQEPREIALIAVAGGRAFHFFVPAFTATDAALDFFAFSQETTIYADDPVAISVARNAAAGDGRAGVSISGYLVDCSAAPCNTSNP